MNRLRNVFGFLMAMLLVAFTLPATAHYDDEKFSLTMAAAAAAGTFTATIKNLSDDDDKIKSFKITAPTTPPGVGITSASTTYAGAIVTNAGGVVSVKNVAIKKGQTIVVTLAGVTFPSTASCGSTNFTWGAKAWESSTWSGEQFALDVSKSTLVTPVTGTCSMVFVTQPTNVLSGGVVGGPVKVQVSPAGAFTGKSVTLSASPTVTSISGNTAAIDASGFATFPALSITGTPGAYTLSAIANVTNSPTAISASFNIAESDGVLDCQGQPNGQTNQFNATSTGGTAVSGNRGINKDNSACNLVVYDLAFRGGDYEIAFAWDTTNQPNAAFSYSVDWKSEFVDSVTGLPKRTKLAWTLTGNVPNYVDGRACLSGSLPAPYGTLSVADTGGGSITVAQTAAPPAVPFPMVIGTERLTVTAIAGSTWSVTRAVGGTATPPGGHPAGASVMSTPFPLDGGGLQVPMCIRNEEFVVLAPDQCTPQNANASCVAVSTTIFDAGDGFASRNF